MTPCDPVGPYVPGPRLILSAHTDAYAHPGAEGYSKLIITVGDFPQRLETQIIF